MKFEMIMHCMHVLESENKYVDGYPPPTSNSNGPYSICKRHPSRNVNSVRGTKGEEVVASLVSSCFDNTNSRNFIVGDYQEQAVIQEI